VAQTHMCVLANRLLQTRADHHWRMADISQNSLPFYPDVWRHLGPNSALGSFCE